VVTGTTRDDLRSGRIEYFALLPPLYRRDMTPINEEPSRTAYCECGALLSGNSAQELFNAAQQHLAHHHPQLLGALELDVVRQMAEERPGAMNA
jgi:hypothetical protein